MRKIILYLITAISIIFIGNLAMAQIGGPSLWYLDGTTIRPVDPTWTIDVSGTGDVESVGDCATGACLDGTSDGGTYIKLYDGDSNYTQISASNTASDVVITLPATTGTLVLTTGNVATATALAGDPADCGANTWANAINASGTLSCAAVTYAGITATTSVNWDDVVSDETGSSANGVWVFSDSPTFYDDITIQAAGVKLTGSDGDITFLGLGDGFDENFTINIDDTENTAVISSSTGLNKFDFGSIAIDADITGAVTGNASTASALAADPANCASSGLAGGITAAGVAEACITPNAGTNIANDLEEEVTEGSLADSVIVSADIKDGVVDEPDLDIADAAGDEECLTYEVDTTNFEWQSCGVGATTWTDIGDATGDTTIALGANETDFTSTIDAAGEAVMTITNTDADATNSNTLLTLSHNDGADVNVFYLSTIADADGTPLTTFSLAQNATVGAISMNFGATGVILSDDADGALTITGNSAGADENLTINLDDVADEITLSTSTAATLVDLDGALDLEISGSDLTIAEAGVKLTGSDGELTILGLGAGNDESLIIDLDDQINVISFQTGSGATILELFGLDLIVGGGNINTGNIALTIGDGTTDSLTIDTDGTGNTELVLENDSIGPAEIDSTTGAYDFGGVTSFEIPNGGPTIDTTGEIGIDTTSDQFAYMGSATKRIMSYNNEICVALENPVDADDNIPFFFPRQAITITDVYCQVDGGTSVAMTISDGTNALEAITCDGDGAEDDGSIANGTFTSLERMEFDLASSSGTNTWLTICVSYSYTVD